MKKIQYLFCFVIGTHLLAAQTSLPCSLPEASQFDFWTGEWELTWNDSLKGTNMVTREMDGCTIHEKFKDPKSNFKGESWSVYNHRKKKWQQTWIDNKGAYLVLEGEFKNGKMELSMEQIDKNGKPVIMSMQFYNISANELDWEWRSSSDKGKTWTTLWKIHYKRKIADEFSKMRIFYFVMLKTGPKRDQDAATAAKIQKGHLNHLDSLYAAGKLSMAGPFSDKSDIRGICVYNVATKEEVEKLTSMDPAVISGRLIVEIHPWFTMPGICLPE